MNRINFYQEADGSWVQIGDTTDVVLEDPILVGFGVCAHDIGQMATGTFSNVVFVAQTHVMYWELY